MAVCMGRVPSRPVRDRSPAAGVSQRGTARLKACVGRPGPHLASGELRAPCLRRALVPCLVHSKPAGKVCEWHSGRTEESEQVNREPAQVRRGCSGDSGPSGLLPPTPWPLGPLWHPGHSVRLKSPNKILREAAPHRDCLEADGKLSAFQTNHFVENLPCAKCYYPFGAPGPNPARRERWPLASPTAACIPVSACCGSTSVCVGSWAGCLGLTVALWVHPGFLTAQL